MSAFTAATYLGGDPDVAQSNLDGTLELHPDGLHFHWKWIDGLVTKAGTLRLAADEIRAATLEDPDTMRSMSRGAAGVLIGGAIGGLIGMATGKRNTILAVTCRRGAFDFTAMFACAPQDGRVFITGWQSTRKTAGLPALPTLAELSDNEAASAADEQTALLRRAVELLEELVTIQRS